MIDQTKETTTHLEVLIDRCIKLDTKRRDSNDKRRAENFASQTHRSSEMSFWTTSLACLSILLDCMVVDVERYSSKKR